MAEVLYVMHKGRKIDAGAIKSVRVNGSESGVAGSVTHVMHKGTRYGWPQGGVQPQGETTLLTGYKRGAANFNDAFRGAFPDAKSFARTSASPPQGAATINLAAAGQPEVLAWDGGQMDILWHSNAEKIYFDENAISMFANCVALQTLDLRGFVTSNATAMSGMFANCAALQTLDLQGFDTSKVTAMGYMFSGCVALQTLDLRGFDTSKVTSMASMFTNCRSLQTLDLRGFDTSKVTSMYSMFSGCAALQTVYASATNADFFRNAVANSGRNPSIVKVVA